MAKTVKQAEKEAKEAATAAKNATGDVYDAVDTASKNIEKAEKAAARATQEAKDKTEMVKVIKSLTLNKEKNAKRVELEDKIASALEANDIETVKKLNAERTALFTSSGRGLFTEVVTEKAEEFLSAEANGELRIVVKVGEKTFCGKTDAARWKGKDRAYLYFDLKKHGLM